MREHILPKQAKQLTKEQFYSLFRDKLVDRKDWANYHHKKVTIGKLFHLLRDYGDVTVSQGGGKLDYVQVTLIEPNGEEHYYTGKHLCDVLWKLIVNLVSRG